MRLNNIDFITMTEEISVSELIGRYAEEQRMALQQVRPDIHECEFIIIEVTNDSGKSVDDLKAIISYV